MFWLGLIIAVCFIPGYTGAMIPTQWAVLSILLPLGLWRAGVFSPSTLAGLAILAWSALSLLWAPNTYDAGYGLWLASIWALAFWFGSTVYDFRPLWQGLAIGLWVSSAVAIAQALGYTPVLVAGDRPAGLLFNSTLLGASATLVIIALVSQRQWFYIPGVLPALVLAQSRGAWLVLALALLTRWFPLRHVLIACIGVTIALLLTIGNRGTDSDIVRLIVWGTTAQDLVFWGHGIGSYNTYFFLARDKLYHPEFVHNDYLQLWFELGVGAVAIFVLYALALTQRTSDHWPIFFAFTLFGLFYFPLWAPIPAFIGCVVAGAMLRDRYLDRWYSLDGRFTSLSWSQGTQSSLNHVGRTDIPAQPNN